MISSENPSQQISTYFDKILSKMTVFKRLKHFELIDFCKYFNLIKSEIKSLSFRMNTLRNNND